jgi:hypothetical protein
MFSLLAAPGPASADPIGSCTPTSGVIVAVDFGHWGGNVQRGCDATPSTGYDALHAAGFSTTGTRHDGPGFICRINDYPTPAEQACVLTPPASAYWSYWHAAAGQNSWSYSTLGAQSYHPPPGSVDAWVYGSTDGGSGGPTFTPAAVRASVAQPPATRTSRPTPPAASPTPPAATAAGAGQPPATGAVGRTPPAASATPSGPARRSAARPPAGMARPPNGSSGSARTGTTAQRPPATAPVSGPAFVDAAPASTSGKPSGSPVPVVLGVTVAGMLAAGAGWATRRRRQGG